VFAAPSTMAVGALNTARARGLRVPEDIAIVGYDDLRFAAESTPPLTSIRQPVDEMSLHAVRLLLEQIRGESAPRSVALSAQLVVRESTVGRIDNLNGAKGGALLVSGCTVSR
jgi:DNA-binding LacI/PurR family transcriptional regulator